MKNNALKLLFFLLLTAGFAACVKTEFDEPPVNTGNVNITPNTSIATLKALRVSVGKVDSIKNDLIISGVVVMDDRSGNYYKSLVIQDSTAGIEVKFNDGFLYQQFPIGRTLYIRCKGLLLTDYNGLTQLIGSVVKENGEDQEFGLTEGQVRRAVVKGAIGAAPAPRKVSINQLSQSMLSTLIELQDVQFTDADANQTYAEPITQNSLNRALEDCDGDETILRSSGFADFAGALTPAGRGTITGVLGIFSGDFQLYIRDLNDVKMDSARCGQGGGGGNLTQMNIADVRALYSGTTIDAPSGRKIKGIVISDRVASNLPSRNLYIQDGTAGIAIRFVSNHSFNLGDEIEINISGQELSEFNKLLQVNDLPLTNATKVGTGSITPRVATVSEVIANFDAWESTLVKISNATITGGSTYSGNKTVNDGSGSIAMFTQSYATFSGSSVPAAPVTVTAIVSDFNAKQILIRNLNDVQQ